MYCYPDESTIHEQPINRLHTFLQVSASAETALGGVPDHNFAAGEVRIQERASDGCGSGPSRRVNSLEVSVAKVITVRMA